jgi:hypothetical protein
MNPDYIKLAKIAYDTVLQTMLEGEKTHSTDEWKQLDVYQHASRAWQHINDYYIDDKSENHIAHAMTRCAMIKLLEGEKK